MGNLCVARYSCDVMALKFVVSKSLLDLGLKEALYLNYQLTDFMEPGISSENNP
jgi:hypothetical protein